MHPLTFKLAKIVQQARGLSRQFAQGQAGQQGDLMIRAFLAMFSKNGQLTRGVSELVADPKALAELDEETEWLYRTSGAMSGNEGPQVAAALERLAVRLEELGATLNRDRAVPVTTVKSTESTRQPISVFVSHSGSDAALAAALVHWMEEALVVPQGSIRCTSVDGYTLDGGDSAPERLRAHLQGSAVVVGLLTKHGLASSYVLMELGAAWALRKTAISLLAAGGAFAAMPGAFEDIHALRMDERGEMASLVDTVAREAKLEKRNDAAKADRALTAFMEAATR